jgi:hypothetical protein
MHNYATTLNRLAPLIGLRLREARQSQGFLPTLDAYPSNRRVQQLDADQYPGHLDLAFCSRLLREQDR